MATPAQLEEGIRRADAAGDSEAVRVLGAELLRQRRAASGQPARQGQHQPAPKRSFAQDLGTATLWAGGSVAEGLAQVADLPMQASVAVQSGLNAILGRGGEAVLNAFGARGTAARLRRSTDATEAALQRTPTLAGSVRAALPGMENMNPYARFAGNVMGGMLVPTGPKGKVPIPTPTSLPRAAQPVLRSGGRNIPNAREVIATGEQVGARTMTSDIRPPRTAMGKWAQRQSERFPVIGTGSIRRGQYAARAEAVRNVAREYGAAVDEHLTSPAIDDVMANFTKTRGAEVAKHAAVKRAVIDGTAGEVAVPNTVKALDNAIAEFTPVGTDASKTLVAKLQNWKQSLMVPGRQEATGLLDASGNPIVRDVAPKGKSLAVIDKIREEMGEAFKDQSLASIRTAGENALQGIYGPMKADMGAFIKQAGGPEKLAAWNKANVQLSGMADELKVSTFKSVLRTGQGTPEDVGRILFSNKPSLVRRLYANLDDAGRARAQTALMQDMIAKAGGMEMTSPAKFVSQVKAHGNSLGVFFKGEDEARINGLARFLQATSRADEAGVLTNSGQELAPAAIVAATIKQPWLLLYPVAARAYESAPVRNMLVGLSKTKPGSKAEAAVLARLTIAMTAAAKNMEATLAKAANENVPARSVAGESPEQDQGQQYGP